jgi:putative chitinase
MSTVTDSQLKAFLPSLADARAWADALASAMSQFEITSPARVAAFLAQTAHESAGFTRLVENLDYSGARLMVVWPGRFPTLEKAAPYARQPERLANFVYARRLGNGDEASGDGWRYRGRGLLQLTGRGNYRSTGLALTHAFVDTPDAASEPRWAALTAAHFWKSRGLNELADDENDDNDAADFTRISAIVCGGRTGLASRMDYWRRARTALGLPA